MEHLSKMAEQLMEDLSTTVSAANGISIDQMFDYSYNFGHRRDEWVRRANADRIGRERQDGEPKWRKQHFVFYMKNGLRYPPVFPERLQKVIHEASLSPREAEVLHFHERMWPIETLTCSEVILDLSQSLWRTVSCRSEKFPCIVPRGRLFKRRAQEWVLAPEAMIAQGYDPGLAQALPNFSHRQI
eukprot:11154255-Lingulodinium_polyedra.AAC.1